MDSADELQVMIAVRLCSRFSSSSHRLDGQADVIGGSSVCVRTHACSFRIRVDKNQITGQTKSTTFIGYSTVGRDIRK